MNILTLQSDYPVVSMSSLGGTVTETVIDIRVFEGIEAVMEEIEDPIVGELIEEQEMEAMIVDEDTPLVSDIVDEETMDAVLVDEETMDGVME